MFADVVERISKEKENQSIEQCHFPLKIYVKLLIDHVGRICSVKKEKNELLPLVQMTVSSIRIQH